MTTLLAQWTCILACIINPVKTLCKNIYQHTCILQLLIAIVGPDPEPRGRDGITQVESGHYILLPDTDTWNRIDKAMAPIVIGWNCHDHYVPTIHLSALEVEQWNLDCITIYSQNSLHIISGMQREHLSEVAKTNWMN